jgi:hypothetical protein
LAEASLLGSHTLNAGASLSIGNLYNNPLNVNAPDAVSVVIRKAAGPTFRTYDQLVTYVGGAAPPTPVPGDYNNNGVVDTADYVVWRNSGPLLNDPTPGVQAADYDFWRSRFGATSGSGSGLAGTTAVPEPTAVVLAFFGLATIFSVSCRG